MQIRDNIIEKIMMYIEPYIYLNMIQMNKNTYQIGKKYRKSKKEMVLLNFIKKTFDKNDFEKYYEGRNLEYDEKNEKEARYNDFIIDYCKCDNEENKKIFEEQYEEYYTYNNLIEINSDILYDFDEKYLDFLLILKYHIQNNNPNNNNFMLMDKEYSSEFDCSGFFYNFGREFVLFNER